MKIRKKVEGMRQFFLQGQAELLRSSEGSQIAELAITLPLLVVILVGIFDFGGAFNVKQKLTNTVREGARLGSNISTGDLNSARPDSITSIRNLINDYMVAAGLNSCGLLTTTATRRGTDFFWTFVASGNNCPGTMTLTIDRSSAVPSTVGGNTNVICTQVKIIYPYRWTFDRVVGLLASGASFSGATPIVTQAVVPNLN